MDKITTTSVSNGFLKVNEFILSDTPQTQIVFQPELHQGGVRGKIIRFKKSKNGERINPASVDFKTLKENEGIAIELGTESITNLLAAISQLNTILESQGIRNGIHRYHVSTFPDINDENKMILIQKILNADYGEDVWNQLNNFSPDLATRLAYSKLHDDRASALRVFEEMLNNDNLSEKNWQNFFEKNTWIFGYGLRYQILRVIQSQPDYGGWLVNRTGGQRGDFLASTEAEKKFTCLVEIKKPDSPLLYPIKYRNGAWRISDELAGAISQIQGYCAQWEISGSRTDQNRDYLEGIYTISPKGIIIIGRTADLDDYSKLNSFERFRRELHSPEIITFDELYERAKYIVGETGSLENTEITEFNDNELPF